MKKILMITALVAATASAAHAEINVGIGIAQPAYPVYVAPQPSVIYYNERPHGYDWNYWHPRDRVVVERRTYVDHDHRDDHRDWDRDHGRGPGKGHGKPRGPRH